MTGRGGPLEQLMDPVRLLVGISLFPVRDGSCFVPE
jgi:hypothetical protein